MKRGELSEKETQLIKKVESEFELFRYKMLSKSRKKIFNGCNEIRFYSCVHEYFIYTDEIAEPHIKACLKCGNIIAELYGLYLKWEHLRYSRWEDIENLLDVLVRAQESYYG